MATGWAHGFLPEAEAPDRGDDPRRALADVLTPALAQGPCFVLFSGGRDSSAVLAAAVASARQEGLAEPIAGTEVYPGVPQADEGEWQAAVIAHLGLREWVKVEYSGDGDLVGQVARDGLRRRGLVWPAPLQVKALTLGQLSPGCLLTGEGGDEVFGAHRSAPLAQLGRQRTVSRRRAAPQAVAALLPEAARRRAKARHRLAANRQPWLRPSVARSHARLLAADEASEPLPWGQALLRLPRSRNGALVHHNFSLLSAEYGLALHDPLLDPGFLRALGRCGPRWGYTSRTEAMRATFSDLLPPAVIERRGKARFNQAFFGAATREFASRWDGAGVDHSMVDAELLRREWLSDHPSALTGALLQAAWLAGNDTGREGPERR